MDRFRSWQDGVSPVPGSFRMRVTLSDARAPVSRETHRRARLGRIIRKSGRFENPPLAPVRDQKGGGERTAPTRSALDELGFVISGAKLTSEMLDAFRLLMRSR